MRYRYCFLFVISLLFTARFFANDGEVVNQPDPEEIIRRVADTYQRDIDRTRDYTYVQRAVSQGLDKNGNVTESRTRTTEIVILSGEPYRKLIAIDDKLLDEIELKREEERQNAFLDKLKEISDEDRKESAETQAQAFQREIGDELPYILDYRIVGDEIIQGQPVWVIQATPRKNYKPKSRTTKLFSKFSGRVWVAKADYTWVKLEAELTEDFSVGLFLFKLHKGLRIEYESTLVDDVWLPVRQSVDMNMRALWNTRRGHTETVYSQHQKFTPEVK